MTESAKAALAVELALALVQFKGAEADLDEARLGIEQAEKVVQDAQDEWDDCFQALRAVSKRVRELGGALPT